MKIYVSNINESWIVDRIKEEWISNNKDITTNKIKDADIVWIISPWLWKKISKKHLRNKIVVCSIYHFDNSDKELQDFIKRDKYVDFYHVISENTKAQISSLTDKNIQSIPFWVNNDIFFNIDDKKNLREKYNIRNDAYLIGSFQRDTEGKDLTSPKLIKGPDRFVEIVKNLYKNDKNLQVLLTGKRRGYLINKFKELNIKYIYFEMTDFKTLNELYNCLDLYIVTSRIEGGPQAILECGITKTPIISTDVGVAPEVLPAKSIFDMTNYLNAEPDTEYVYSQSKRFIVKSGQEMFRKMFKDIVNF